MFIWLFHPYYALIRIILYVYQEWRSCKIYISKKCWTSFCFKNNMNLEIIFSGQSQKRKKSGLSSIIDFYISFYSYQLEISTYTRIEEFFLIWFGYCKQSKIKKKNYPFEAIMQ